MTPSKLSLQEAQSMARGGAIYVRVGRVRAAQLAADHVWKTSHGSTLRGDAGDWIVSDDSDSWTVDDEIFRSTYRPTGDDSYEKSVAVRAVRLDRDAEIETLEGIARANRGDWLALGAGGDVWPIPARRFEKTYTRVQPPAQN